MKITALIIISLTRVFTLFWATLFSFFSFILWTGDTIFRSETMVAQYEWLINENVRVVAFIMFLVTFLFGRKLRKEHLSTKYTRVTYLGIGILLFSVFVIYELFVYFSSPLLIPL